jgi:hypothetical protein
VSPIPTGAAAGVGGVIAGGGTEIGNGTFPSMAWSNKGEPVAIVDSPSGSSS